MTKRIREKGRKANRREAEASIPPADQAAEPPWRWHCRCDHRKTDVIDYWEKKDLSVTARVNFDRKRDQLRQLPFHYWKRPHACSVGDHIYVIHFKDESRKQWRVFGFAEVATSAFVMTNTAFEKDDVYHPHDSKDRAAGHRDVVRSDFERYAVTCFKPKKAVQ